MRKTVIMVFKAGVGGGASLLCPDPKIATNRGRERNEVKYLVVIYNERNQIRVKTEEAPPLRYAATPSDFPLSEWMRGFGSTLTVYATHRAGTVDSR
jgi:hypothetical protein